MVEKLFKLKNSMGEKNFPAKMALPISQQPLELQKRDAPIYRVALGALRIGQTKLDLRSP